MDRLTRQINFLVEIDKLKQVGRQTLLMDGSRNENDAEHSWHLAMAVIILSEESNFQHIDMLKVIKMVLIHDIVEIDAGDTYAYDTHAHHDKQEREQKAARRIFGLLPDDQRDEMNALWEAFEASTTDEAKLANALDRFMPILHNYRTKGRQWLKHEVTDKMVINRNKNIKDGAAALWEYVLTMIKNAVEEGMLRQDVR